MKRIMLLFIPMFLLTFITGCKKEDPIKYDYDGKGVLVSTTNYLYGSKGNVSKTRTDVIYDENDKELFVYYYRDDETEPYKYITNKYNEKGQITKK